MPSDTALHLANDGILRVSLLISYFPVTRSHKLNDRDHSGAADRTAASHEFLPRYFAKSGPVDADPRKTKKDGGGKGNWYAPDDFFLPALCLFKYISFNFKREYKADFPD
jgi:hypothetical protein